MNQPTYIDNNFLVAMPSLMAPLFYHSVVYICEHTDEGAMGIIINRPLDIQLSEILDQMGLPISNPEVYTTPVLCGGPVQMERGFVIHQSGESWDGTVELGGGVYISSSRQVLEAIAQGEGPENALVALGYSGWEPGQLESELAENSWFNVPSDMHTLFETEYESRWQTAASQAGIDMSKMISSQVGHA